MAMLRSNTAMILPILILSFTSSLSGIVFKVPESVPIGHVIGFVEEWPKIAKEPRYFVVYGDQAAEKILKLDEQSGKITTIAQLDYEGKKKFEIMAIPVEGGDGIQIRVEVEDENDHTPKFPEEKIGLEISEFARIGAEYPLPTAVDEDGEKYTVHKYRIAQGNVNNVFKISTRRIGGIHYADLIVNGQLDREYRDKYELIVEAVDGGKPEKIGRLRIAINILDANDNAPIFSQPRYSTSIPANLSIGSHILTLKALDADIGDNGVVNFRFQKTHFESVALFSLSSAGVLSSAAHIPPGFTHDFVVVAYDKGMPPLESTALVTVSVQGTSLSSQALDIVWLTETESAHLLENITLGSIVARISLNNKQGDSTVSLSGCPSLCMQQSDSPYVYLLLICGLFDREVSPEYHLKFSVRRDGELVLEHPVLLSIGDVNDNSPSWPTPYIHILLNRSEGVAEQSASLIATDPDLGSNGKITYSLFDTDILSIDQDTGRLLTLKELDCSVGPELRFRVHAEDNGHPPLYSELQVTADIVDGDNRAPQFEKSLYEINVQEDSDVGTCFLKIKANSSLCGGSSRIRYAIQDNRLSSKIFNIDSLSGTFCLEKHLDYEATTSYQFTISATDQNGLTGTSLISVRIVDVNDNVPVFYPTNYNITVRDGPHSLAPLMIVSATDKDSFGKINFYMESGDSSLFRVDVKTGEIFAQQRLAQGIYELVIQAKDGSGLPSEQSAHVHIHVIANDAPAPSFTQSQYVIKTSEDILPGIAIGSVQAIGPGKIEYSIYSGDPDHYFAIHPTLGRITVVRYLDAEKYDSVLLNIQADLLNGASNHTQVVIKIEDHNDNSPQFSLDTVEITVREDQPMHEPFYIVHATDNDKKMNGAVSYFILSSHPPCPIMVQPLTGQLQLTGNLDYEAVRYYMIRIKAQDNGIPPKSSNMTLILHVSDVNDNSPVFEKKIYEATVVENSPLMTEVVKLSAKDLDSNENGKITYMITNGTEVFGIDKKVGILYVNKEIDREIQNFYNITVIAKDNGNPSLSSFVVVHISISDVNDNAPSCTSVTPLVVPQETTTQGSFGTIIITDRDNGENGTVVYRSQQAHPLFLVKGNGEVQLRRPLKETDPQDFRLYIIASDQGSPRKSTVCQVPIRIVLGSSAVQLVEPFDRTVYVESNCERDCKLRKINATGVAKWQLQSSDISNHFSIDEGWLTLRSLPTSRSSWSLTLILSDREGKQKLIAMKIISSKAKNLRESVKLSPLLPVGSRVAHVGKISSNREWFYNIVNETSPFELDQFSSEILLLKNLRNYAGKTFTLLFQKISVPNYEVEESEITFEIDIGPTEKPFFDNEIVKISLMEDTLIGSAVFTVNATVNDPSASISYRLKESNSHFSIDQYSGEIILTDELDVYNSSQYLLSVQAATGSSTSNMLIIIDIIDVNNNYPVIQNSNDILVWPDSPKIIHYVIASDKDSGENAELSFQIIPEHNDFNINKKTGALSMLRNPLLDQSILIRVSDQGSPPLYTDQILNIRISNDTKRWKYFDRTEYTIKIASEVKKGATVVDIGGSGATRLKLFPETKIFKLDQKSGIIIVDGNVKDKSYTLTVMAQSSTGEVDWAVVSVEVAPPETIEGPTISSASCGSITVPENRSIKEMKNIVVTGNGSEVLFRLQSSTSLFEIEPSTGQISCSQLDREMKSEHLLVVIADENGKTDSCTIRVTVADENDNSPQFASSTPQVIFLNATTSVGTVVHRFVATDPDLNSNGKVLFQLIEDSSKMFDIITETGDLILARNLPTTQKEWMIRVRAYDQGIGTLKIDRYIRVKNDKINLQKYDSQPSFLYQEYISSIDEGLDRGQVITKVSVISVNAPVTYSIIEGNTDGAFEVDSDGVVRTSQELDYEKQSEYILKIIGTGDFPEQISTRVIIRVNNLNDNPPFIPLPKKRKVPESLPFGSYITTILANDMDKNRILEYTLESGEDKFVIDRFTGVIHSKTNLDYETTKEMTAIVKVTDGNFSNTTSLQVSIMDVNDNVPKFSQHFYEIKIPLSTHPDDVIIKLMAVDRDSDENGRVSYSMSGGEGYFQIDEFDGTISAISFLSVNSEFIVTVTATDHGSPALTSSVPLRIIITKDDMEERPMFPRNEYEFFVSESLPVYSIFGNVSVSRDSLWYRIINSEAANLFNIDRMGRISINSKLDREKKDFYKFQIDVSSGWSNYHQNSSAMVTVRVTDVNDNSPRFSVTDISVIIKDGMNSGDFIQRITASDEDFGENGRVSYRILSGNDFDLLSLNADSGALVFNEWNDEQLLKYESGMWTMMVEARDNGIKRRSSLLPVKVFINLASWSGTAPFFVTPNYVIPVLESSAHGSVVFVAHATNRLGMMMKGLSYRLKNSDEFFSINPSTGTVTLVRPLDYETRTSHKMSLSASDKNGRSAVLPLEFIILPADEYPPVFTESSYSFQIPVDAEVGSVIGTVQAVDADGGQHGVVTYRVDGEFPLIAVNRISGQVTLRHPIHRGSNFTIEQFTLIAESSLTQQSKTTVHLEIGTFPSQNTHLMLSSNILKVAAFVTALLFLFLLILLICCVFGYRTQTKEIENPRKQVYSVRKGQTAVISDMSRMSPSYSKDKLTSLPSNVAQKTTSITSSVSTSSGLRHSILSNRDFISTRSQPDSGIDPDTVSLNSSVTDYLVSIGVNPNPIPQRIKHGENGYMTGSQLKKKRVERMDSSFSEMIYARLEDIITPGPLNMSQNLESLEPSTNLYVPQRNLPPTFQPLTEILNEIAEMQRQEKAKREYVQVEI